MIFTSVYGNIANKQKNLGGSIAILCDGDTHPLIPSAGTYLYVMNNTHGLSDGLYVSNNGFLENAQVTSSRVTAVTDGGLNVLSNRVSLGSNHTITSTTVTSGSFKTLESFTITESGVYVITAVGSFSDGSGIRILLLDTSETNSNTSANSVLAEGRATLEKVRLIGFSTSEVPITMYIRAYQNSGSDMSVGGCYRVLKVK